MTELNISDEHLWETWVEELIQLPPQEQLEKLLMTVSSQRARILQHLSEELEMRQLIVEQESMIQQLTEEIENLSESDQELRKALELRDRFTSKLQELELKEETLRQYEDYLSNRESLLGS